LANSVFVHIISDSGPHALENTVAQASVLRFLPSANIILSPQHFKKGNVMTPALFLKLVKSSFPEGTFHFCYLGIETTMPARYCLAACNGSFYFAPDNGILPIALKGLEATYYPLPVSPPGTDVMSEIYLPIAKLLADNQFNIPSDWQEKAVVQEGTLIVPTRTDNILRLTVLFNDSHGNAYVNLDKEAFYKLTEGKRFSIRPAFKVGIGQISRSYRDEGPGSAIALFGLGDLLQIAIIEGSAQQYLALEVGKILMLEIL
jgi:S-adenosylmethionine hydrolase